MLKVIVVVIKVLITLLKREAQKLQTTSARHLEQISDLSVRVTIAEGSANKAGKFIRSLENLLK